MKARKRASSYLDGSYFGDSEDQQRPTWLQRNSVSLAASEIVCCWDLLPVRETGLRLYDPSIAASKDLIVSSGRSSRGRVGLDRSGSAAGASATTRYRQAIGNCSTYDVSIRIAVLHIANRLDGRLF